jgi:glucokinase
VIAITSSQSPLARKADVSLMIDHAENSATQVPMIGRILHLLVIDILIVGVTMQRQNTGLPILDSDASASLDESSSSVRPSARRAGLGVSSAGQLAHLAPFQASDER